MTASREPGQLARIEVFLAPRARPRRPGSRQAPKTRTPDAPGDPFRPCWRPPRATANTRAVQETGRCSGA